MSDPELFREPVSYRLPSGEIAGPILVTVDTDDDGEEWLRSVEFTKSEQPKHAPSYGHLLLMAIAVHLHKQQDYERSYPPEGRRYAMADVGLASDAEVNEVRKRRRNNRITKQLLGDTAQLYLEGGAGKVASELGVSRRSADRYVKAAREEGLLG